jgi:hypothetical protein
MSTTVPEVEVGQESTAPSPPPELDENGHARRKRLLGNKVTRAAVCILITVARHPPAVPIEFIHARVSVAREMREHDTALRWMAEAGDPPFLQLPSSFCILTATRNTRRKRRVLSPPQRRECWSRPHTRSFGKSANTSAPRLQSLTLT